MVANKLNEQKRQHRERAQPLHRKKLGLLEKHSDYVKRARDFHSKERRIQKLKEKASMRNKDEFYHSMVNQKTKNGVHIQSRGNEPLPVDLVKVLKSQDSGYIRTQLTMEQSRVQKLKEKIASLVDDILPQPIKPTKEGEAEASEMNGDLDEWDMYSDEEDSGPVASGSGRTHVVFTDDLDAVRSADPSSLLTKRQTPTSLPTSSLSSSSLTPRSASKKGKSKASSSSYSDAILAAQQRELDLLELSESASQHRSQLLTELSARETRLSQLKRANRELELQKIMMSSGARKEIVQNKGGDKGKREEEWWLGGGKPGKNGKKGAEEEDRAGLPNAEEGVTTGARVWKFKAQRKR
ncbi:rRNA-processing protein UTP11 [Sporobolomyces salmoneus]|uniref:rRNA-processing protein UTP11 n=1 Tax=Sporobolomyces salmoneus TaxID=183962 RepID=UPI0031829022